MEKLRFVVSLVPTIEVKDPDVMAAALEAYLQELYGPTATDGALAVDISVRREA